MATADEILAAIKALRHDLTVFGTTSLNDTVEDFATRQRQALAKLDQLDERLTTVEQALGITT